MNEWIAGLIVGAVVFSALFSSAAYNRLVGLKVHCENAFAQIDVQLKRRYDLIPNLVECVKGYMFHERETLERVIAARNVAMASLRHAADQPEDSDAHRTWLGAEGTLTGALGRLSLAIESYPELKANAAVASLTEELTSTENRIAYARQAYNDWVSGFNTYRQGFPVCLLAGLVGFGKNRELVEFADRERLAEAPRVALA